MDKLHIDFSFLFRKGSGSSSAVGSGTSTSPAATWRFFEFEKKLQLGRREEKKVELDGYRKIEKTYNKTTRAKNNGF